MTHSSKKIDPTQIVLGCIFTVLLISLYSPILYVIYTSFSADINWPFPFEFSLDGFRELSTGRSYKQSLFNSVMISLGSAAIATFFATLAAMSVLKYRSRYVAYFAVLFVAPLFVAELVVGIATLVFNKQLLELSGGLTTTAIANSAHVFSFAFLIVLSQLARYDWRLEEAAAVFGARPLTVFFEVTLPTIWSAILGAFLTSFLITFNGLDITFYNIGAKPTLPTISWGSLRYGLKPELFSLATLVNGFIVIVFLILYILMRKGIVKFGYRGE